MRRKYLVTALTAIAASTAVSAVSTGVAGAATQGRVTVRVEGASKTVLARRRVRIRSGWVVKGGHGRDLCPRASAQGALAEATHGHWSGIWYASYDEWEITKIRGARPRNSSHWWEMFVNGEASQVGACQQQLAPRDHLLFALVSGSGEDALGVHAPRAVAQGTAFRVRVFYYDSAGHHHPLAGATVKFAGHRVRTGQHGYARLHAGALGAKKLRAYRHGYVRTETRIKVD